MIRWDDGGNNFHYLNDAQGVRTMCGIELGKYDERRKLAGYEVKSEFAVKRKNKCRDCVIAAGGIPHNA